MAWYCTSHEEHSTNKRSADMASPEKQPEDEEKGEVEEEKEVDCWIDEMETGEAGREEKGWEEMDVDC